ncbi:hypothetical protein [Neodiprion abietis nucleopolyhedrovirus]|uniref:Uncharacterized protein p33 n=1 Tax=Neodiprion abietis nucleopolyhedrovirus TaxID=204507 RepID=Q0ZP72_9CBAC|nr:hypothetical protein [Neodiprion abietis nucleopolyhedrovirus]ABC74882.1 unknown [Neodiprion abietis nucleopolyhedrovirus]
MPSQLMDRYIDMLKFEIKTIFRQIHVNITNDSVVDIMKSEVAYYLQLWASISHQNISKEFMSELLVALKSNKNFDTTYADMLERFNVVNLQPVDEKPHIRRYWDLIHLIAHVIDELIDKRNMQKFDVLSKRIQNLTMLISNIYYKLGCAMCVEHWFRIQGYLIQAIERLNISRLLERDGVAVYTVNLEEDDGTEHTIPKHFCLYRSFQIHNHVNNYRAYQDDQRKGHTTANVIQKTKQLQLYRPIRWLDYKKLLFD